ncbi:hypothetical protein [Mycolicibacterium palauense]|uniref:hypothetical protein n=1 Tax=Mycolicibacterium palauense TaxID=2034511 RepID=UPI000BFEE974|nr:hypothetical protein [Mycolicibacterium palauense]
MQIAGVLALVVAALSALTGLWTLSRPRHGDVPADVPADVTGGLRDRVLRAVAPTQLAAALILTVGGVVALAGPPRVALVVFVVAVLGAVGTVAAGCWQAARYALRQQALSAAASDCDGSGCASCTLSAACAEREA